MLTPRPKPLGNQLSPSPPLYRDYLISPRVYLFFYSRDSMLPNVSSSSPLQSSPLVLTGDLSLHAPPMSPPLLPSPVLSSGTISALVLSPSLLPQLSPSQSSPPNSALVLSPSQTSPPYSALVLSPSQSSPPTFALVLSPSAPLSLPLSVFSS